MPLLGVVCYVDDSHFSLSGDIFGTPKFKMDHLTLTTPILRVICHPYAGLDKAYLYSKFDQFSFSCSADMVGATKIQLLM